MHKVESTLVLRRIYDAPIARVWQAWTDPKELARWYVAGADHVVGFSKGMQYDSSQTSTRAITDRKTVQPAKPMQFEAHRDE